MGLRPDGRVRPDQRRVHHLTPPVSSSPPISTTHPIVVKIGGSTLGAHDTTLEDLATLQRQGTVAVVVHGGGATISQWLKVHDLPSTFVRGLRVTDAAGLEVVTAVLAGVVNKTLVAGLLALGGRAVGLSGVDGGTVEGRAQDAALGYVGEATRIQLGAITALLDAGFMPVLSTVGYNPSATCAPRLLNFNADTVAGEIARAIGASRLIFLTDVPGVLDQEKRLMPHLSAETAAALIEDGTAAGGMIPKLEACLTARSRGTESWIIDGRAPHSLLAAVTGSPNGTRIW
ncbi:MAG: acetylglutamate kinase [Dehalococcoidia bacterium]|nr:acetylglutamate kinase [Dehalococcoidia bacterium]